MEEKIYLGTAYRIRSFCRNFFVYNIGIKIRKPHISKTDAKIIVTITIRFTDLFRNRVQFILLLSFG